MTRDRQLSMSLAPTSDQSLDEVWLGVTIDHRELFDALQDEWLSPTRSGGRILRVSSYTQSPPEEGRARFIQVHLRLRPLCLPSLDVPIRRKGKWLVAAVTEVRKTDEAVYWPGPIPTFSIAKIVVSTDEERARLIGIARQVSNIALPETASDSELDQRLSWDAIPRPHEPTEGLSFTPDLDALRGATAMAVTCVPRVDPWFDLLVACLGNDSHKRKRLADDLSVPWWNHPPWIQSLRDQSSGGLEEQLWLSASAQLRSRASDVPDALTLITKIADGVSSTTIDRAASAALADWVRETVRMLRAERTIDLDKWKDAAVRTALQLLLLRPEPTRLMTWWDDLPALPPAVWWSAAVLCGLLHGYRRLDVRFRGDSTQRRLLSLHAMAMESEPSRTHILGGVVTNSPAWLREQGEIAFVWGNDRFGSRPEGPRSKWYRSDLDDPLVHRSALDLARRLRWPCIDREITLTDDEAILAGSEKANLAPIPGGFRLTVQGSARIRLPSRAAVQERIDSKQFRQFLTTEGIAHLEEPPNTTRRGAPGETGVAESTATYGAPVIAVPGLRYVAGFVSASEEENLISTIDAGPWRRDLQRRVQHYGWRYDYRARQIDRSMRLGPLPAWAVDLGERLFKLGLVEHIPDQVIVNEYVRKQGVSRHVDCIPCFSDGIAMVSLLESWEMFFVRERGDRQKFVQLLERRSVAVMTGEARYGWSHEIPKRLTEPTGLRRGRRISLTFRKVDEKAIKSSRDKYRAKASR